MLEPIVYLVDDDDAVRDGLSLLIRSIGLSVKPYGNPQHFLDEFDRNNVGCIVLDIRMPAINGMAVHEQLANDGCTLPVIFITGHGDIVQCRRAFKNGASDFLTKPIDELALLDSLQKAIKTSIATHQQHQTRANVSSKLEKLSTREHDVFNLIVEGLPNKTIARELGLALRTVENHRAAVFDKLEAESLADLVKMYMLSCQLTT